MPRRHKNAFHTVSREAFERAVAELDAAIPSLQEFEIIVRLQQIIAMVGDAHTTFSTFPPKTFRRYPLSLVWFGDELRVTRTVAAYRRALGGRVVRIGEASVTDVSAKVSHLVPQENDYWVRFVSPGYMTSPEVLFTLKILPGFERGQWTFEDTEGKQFSLEMSAVLPDEKIEWLSTLKDVPLYRQRQGEQFWFTPLPGSQTLYVNLRGYPEASTFKRLADDLLKSVDASPPGRLVIDVRQNTGGDFNKGRYLLSGLKKRDAFRNRGSVYVITGRATQSAAMVNALDFRKELNAVLVGEPTGGRPNSYSENDEFRLPNSNLEVSYSTKYYKFQDADTPAVMPDKVIEPSWESYPSGRDLVIEWILAQPLSK
ncbi:MAG TPA: hypothetical protein VNA16_01490 [Abditibacteriaceae bacterium]|nr:hypothetical protein [Abditibacteriaceae bacterium]